MLYELKRIKQMRQKLGLTQIELAKLSGVSQSLITKIERGSTEPSYTIAKKIFTILDEKLTSSQKKLTAKNICTKNITFIESDDEVDKAINLMKKHAISQIPVTKKDAIVGGISEETFIKNYDQIKNKETKIEEIMDEPFPTVSEDANTTLIKDILKSYSAVILTKKGNPTGIITKADLLKRI